MRMNETRVEKPGRGNDEAFHRRSPLSCLPFTPFSLAPESYR